MIPTTRESAEDRAGEGQCHGPRPVVGGAGAAAGEHTRQCSWSQPVTRGTLKVNAATGSTTP